MERRIVTSLATSPTSVARQIADTRRLLSASLTDELTTLATDYTAGTDSLTLSTVPKRLGPGTVLSSGEATWYVLANTSSQCTVIAGYEGNPDVNVAAGSVVRVSPRFTDYQLFTTIKQVIGSLSSPLNGLYGIVKWQDVRDDEMYPIPDEILPYLIRILQVRSKTTEDDWSIDGAYTTSLSPGSEYVRVYNYALMHEFIASVKIIPPADFTSDLITYCGLTDTMLDIPSLGAAGILMNGQEARRVHLEAQGDPRRAEQVPMTGGTNAARELRRMFSERVNEEAVRIQQRVGVTKQVLP